MALIKFQKLISQLNTEIDDHKNDLNNPHVVTASQVGADSVGTAFDEVSQHEVTYDHTNLTEIPALEAYISTNLTLTADNTVTLVPLDVVNFGNEWWTGNPDYKWTPSPGTYLIILSSRVVVTDGGITSIYLYKNGLIDTINVTNNTRGQVVALVTANGTDYFQFYLSYTSTGPASSADSGISNTNMKARKLI